jgi:hypothetical protein
MPERRLTLIVQDTRICERVVFIACKRKGGPLLKCRGSLHVEKTLEKGVWCACGGVDEASASGGPGRRNEDCFRSTRGPRLSFFLFCRMPAPELEGQFDDAPIDKLPEDIRQQYNYIDDTPSEHSDDDFDSEELDDDHARVEDEDWEIAERGGCSNPTLQISPFFDSPHHKTLLKSTIACDSILP